MLPGSSVPPSHQSGEILSGIDPSIRIEHHQEGKHWKMINQQDYCSFFQGDTAQRNCQWLLQLPVCLLLSLALLLVFFLPGNANVDLITHIMCLISTGQ